MQAFETCPAKVRRVQSWFWRGPCGSCAGPGSSPRVLAALPASVAFWSLLLSVHVCWLLCRPLSRSGLFSSQSTCAGCSAGLCRVLVSSPLSPRVLAALPASVAFWSLLLSGPSPACRLPTCSGAPVPRTGVRAGGQIQLLPARLARREAVASSCSTHTGSESSRSNPSLVPQPQLMQPSFR